MVARGLLERKLRSREYHWLRAGSQRTGPTRINPSRAGGGRRARTRTGTATPLAGASARDCAARRCAS